MNPIASRLTPTATQRIRMDHAEVLAMFHALKPDLAAPVREARIREICAALALHAQLEEEVFYPALRDAAVQSPALAHAVSDHDEMRRLIERVRTPGDPRTDPVDAVNALMKAVLHHVADEETEMLPAAEKVLGPDRLAELGARMQQRRRELARPALGERAADAVRAAPVKSALVAAGALLAVTAVAAAVQRRRW